MSAQKNDAEKDAPGQKPAPRNRPVVEIKATHKTVAFDKDGKKTEQ